MSDAGLLHLPGVVFVGPLDGQSLGYSMAGAVGAAKPGPFTVFLGGGSSETKGQGEEDEVSFHGLRAGNAVKILAWKVSG